jgi:hypothetical protein
MTATRRTAAPRQTRQRRTVRPPTSHLPKLRSSPRKQPHACATAKKARRVTGLTNGGQPAGRTAGRKCAPHNRLLDTADGRRLYPQAGAPCNRRRARPEPPAVPQAGLTWLTAPAYGWRVSAVPRAGNARRSTVRVYGWRARAVPRAGNACRSTVRVYGWRARAVPQVGNACRSTVRVYGCRVSAVPRVGKPPRNLLRVRLELAGRTASRLDLAYRPGIRLARVGRTAGR